MKQKFDDHIFGFSAHFGIIYFIYYSSITLSFYLKSLYRCNIITTTIRIRNGFARLRDPNEQLNPKLLLSKQTFQWRAQHHAAAPETFRILRETESRLSLPPHVFIINRNTVLFHSSNPLDVFLFRLRFHTFFETRCPPSEEESSLANHKDHLHHSSED